MDNLTVAELSLILAQMAQIANEGVGSYKDYLGPQNTALLSILARILGEGADCCVNLAKDKIDGA